MCIIARLINNMIFKLFFCLVVLSSICVNCNVNEEVIVEQGRLLGTTFSSRNGTEYYGFLTIPFAKAPIGELRFEVINRILMFILPLCVDLNDQLWDVFLQPPQPPAPWEGIRNATTVPPVCTQKIPAAGNGVHNLLVAGQEDCLYLNVYTPKVSI